MAAALPQLAQTDSLLCIAPTFNAEFDLLLACVNSSAKLTGEAIEQAIAQKVDWDSFAHMAGHDGVLPLVFQRLLACSPDVPENALANFRRLHQINSRKTLWLTSELLRIVEQFTQRGINFLAYKGSALGQLLYGDVTARQFGDLDLLVHPADVTRAVSLVRELGYRSELDLTLAQENAYFSIGYEYSFDSQFGRNLLEIKWQVLPRFYAIDFDIEKIFLRATSVKIGELEVPTLSPEDLLLVLCVHAAKHGWEKVSWLCDIAALTQRVPLDWNAIQQQAEKLGIERILAINLSLANKLLHIEVPVLLRACSANDPTIGNIVIRNIVKKIMARIAACHHCDVTSKSYFREYAGLRERKLDRAKFWWRLITTPNVSEWKAAKLRNPRSPLYLGIRLSRLAAKLIRN
ncbi:MAG TPA: nucleotidyltransferase family protein [Terriglobales bacterium]